MLPGLLGRRRHAHKSFAIVVKCGCSACPARRSAHSKKNDAFSSRRGRISGMARFATSQVCLGLVGQQSHWGVGEAIVVSSSVPLAVAIRQCARVLRLAAVSGSPRGRSASWALGDSCAQGAVAIGPSLACPSAVASEACLPPGDGGGRAECGDHRGAPNRRQSDARGSPIALRTSWVSFGMARQGWASRRGPALDHVLKHTCLQGGPSGKPWCVHKLLEPLVDGCGYPLDLEMEWVALARGAVRFVNFPVAALEGRGEIQTLECPWAVPRVELLRPGAAIQARAETLANIGAGRANSTKTMSARKLARGHISQPMGA